MKGFKDKSGKFRPTGTKSKSNLKKSDVRKKETVGVKEVNNVLRTKKSNPLGEPYTLKDLERIGKEWDSLSEQERKKIIINTHNGYTEGHDANIVKDWDELGHYVKSNIAQHWEDAHDPFDKERAGFFGIEPDARNKVSIQEGLHRPQRNDGKFTPLTEAQKQENIDALVEDTDAIYIAMVEQFPNSSVGGDVHRWAESGSYGNHGHFGEALREGRIADAMYRADGDNLEHLGELHIENLLSTKVYHPDDPSDRAIFLSRLEWASGRTQEQRDFPLGRPTGSNRSKSKLDKLPEKVNGVPMSAGWEGVTQAEQKRILDEMFEQRKYVNRRTKSH